MRHFFIYHGWLLGNIILYNTHEDTGEILGSRVKLIMNGVRMRTQGGGPGWPMPRLLLRADGSMLAIIP